MLQLSLSQSQYFSSKSGKNVKRGLEKNLKWAGIRINAKINSLEEQIEQELSKYQFEKEFKELLFKVIDKENENKSKENEIIANNLKDKIYTLKIEKTNLTKLTRKVLISDEKFQKQRNEYDKEISTAK